MTDEPKRGAMTPARMKRIWEREGGVCWFCTKPVPMRGQGVVTYDHRIPLEIIGHDGDENIYPIHRDPCDKLKTAADQAKIAKVRRQSGAKGQAARRAQNGSQLKGRPFEKGPKKAWPKRSFPSKISGDTGRVVVLPFGMVERTTRTISVRAKHEVIDRFIERCHELGIAPNKALADFIAAPTTTIRPAKIPPRPITKPTLSRPAAPAKKKAVAGNPAAPLAKPTGFDAITGEPIFKSGVGPRGGKKK